MSSRQNSSLHSFAFAIAALLAPMFCLPGAAALAAGKIKTVFVIDFENRNWTQPIDDPQAPPPLFGNPAAPYINSLVTPSDPNSALVSFATSYHNAKATPSGQNASIHPSELNYLWQEGASNFGVHDDADPYGKRGTQAQVIANYLEVHPDVCGQTLSALLQQAGISWKAYAEDTDLANSTGGNVNLEGVATSKLAPRETWTVPFRSFSGSSPDYVNPYNGSHQYYFAAKHVGPLFFTATNGGTPSKPNIGPDNPEAAHYAPLQQLEADLTAGTVARYNLITPDQYNDMHTALSDGFTYHGLHYTGSMAEVAQGDHFLSILIPKIMASEAFRDNGVIVLWTDETEGINSDDFKHTLMEIVISPLARGHAYAVKADLTHSSDVATWQKVFGVAASTPTGFLNDAARPSNGSGARDLAEFFQEGVVPDSLKSQSSTAGQ